VKEGRKYDLGAAAGHPAAGQHLRSRSSARATTGSSSTCSRRADLNVPPKRANAHFSDDLLSSLLNEPLKGHGIFWSSESPRPFPVPIRVLDFGAMYEPRDRQLDSDAGQTWGRENAAEAGNGLSVAGDRVRETPPEFARGAAEGKERPVDEPTEEEDQEEVDPAVSPDPFMEACRVAIEQLFANEYEMNILRTKGRTWGRLMHVLANGLPETWEDRLDRARELVKTFLDSKFGKQGEAWHTEPNEKGQKVVHIGPEPT
jgi:hypothetical protein